MKTFQNIFTFIENQILWCSDSIEHGFNYLFDYTKSNQPIRAGGSISGFKLT